MADVWGAHGERLGARPSCIEKVSSACVWRRVSSASFPSSCSSDDGCSLKAELRHRDSCSTIPSSASMVSARVRPFLPELGLAHGQGELWREEINVILHVRLHGLGSSVCRARCRPPHALAMYQASCTRPSSALIPSSPSPLSPLSCSLLFILAREPRVEVVVYEGDHSSSDWRSACLHVPPLVEHVGELTIGLYARPARARPCVWPPKLGHIISSCSWRELPDSSLSLAVVEARQRNGG
ncbi:hypothetical protein Dimus_013740 [Dionaea muscipula]